MNEVVIKFDRMKIVRNQLVLFFVYILYMCMLGYLYLNYIHFPMAYFMVGAMIGFIIIFIINFKSAIKAHKSGLIINSESIHFKGSRLGCKIGKITWDKVEDIHMNSTFIFLKLKDKELFNSKCSKSECQTIASKGVPITNEELSISFNEMKKIICTYYKQYKIQNS